MFSKLIQLIVITCLFAMYGINVSAQTNIDSLRKAQQDYRDSVRAEQDRRADSLAAVRAYLRSKEYNDSLDAIRQARRDSINAARQRISDSLQAERQRIKDSATAAIKKYNDSVQTALAAQRAERQRIMDSTNLARQQVLDSLKAIQDYRQSDRYKDSVAAERQRRIDSATAARQKYNDSMRTVRQQQIDSLKKERQRYNDSLTAYLDSVKTARQIYLDSMKVARQQIKDSLDKVKAKRELAKEEREKQKAKQKKLAEEEKIKKKQDAYTNQDMLKKKWGPIRRAVHNTFTRYNYYYNAEKKMDEAIENMFRARQDNLDTFIALFPFDPLVDSAKLKNDMDSIIKRSGIGIQLHDPRAKWQDDLFMIVGQAYYYKGDFKNAAAAFKYIVTQAEKMEQEAIKNKKTPENNDIIIPDKEGFIGSLEHKSSKNDALLWLSRVYTDEGDHVKSKIILDLVAQSENLPERLKGELAFNRAYYQLHLNNNEAAIPDLITILNDKETDHKLRIRAGFLAGQILQSIGLYDSAITVYNSIYPLYPSADIEFKARINSIYAGMNSNNIDNNSNIAVLESLSQQTKYQPFYDQIYYALAQAHLKNNNTKLARINLQESINRSLNNKRQKGLSFLELGNIHYQEKNYLAAKSAYDSTLLLLLKTDQPYYDIAYKKSNGLAVVAAPGAKVAELDSLLHLASLSEREQKQAVRKYIKDMEDAKATSGAKAPATGMPGSFGGSWYFLNETLAQKGEAEFKMKWGNRPLKDNWRTSRTSDGVVDPISDETGENLFDEDYLLAKIPKGKPAIDSMNNLLADAYFNLGSAYFKIQDYNNAESTYNKLLSIAPKYPKGDLVYYDLYLIELARNNKQAAIEYLNKLAVQFPNSTLNKTIANSNTKSNTDSNQTTSSIEQHYEQTYNLLKTGSFNEVIVRTSEVKSIYPVESVNYQKRYNFMEAIAYAGNGNYDRADTLLSIFINATTDDSLKNWAKEVQKFVKDKQKGVSNPTTNSNVLSGIVPIADMEYNLEKTSPHYVIFSAGMLDGRLMGLKAGLSDFNALQKSALNLNSSITNLDAFQSIIVVKEFPNAAQAKIYLNEVLKHKTLTRDFNSKDDLKSVIISQANLSRLMQRKDFGKYIEFYNDNY